MSQLEITIWNGAGEIVHQDIHEAEPCLTEEELQEAIYMIEHGTSAHVAVMLAKQHP